MTGAGTAPAGAAAAPSSADAPDAAPTDAAAPTAPPAPVLMAHIIPYFPDKETSRAIATAVLNAGARYLEVQFPFSDPSADGPLIEAASQTALHQGFTVDNGFLFIQQLMNDTPPLREGRAEIFLMTYASIIYARGIKRFTHDAQQVGVRGIIAPDLPPDSDEGLAAAANDCGIQIIPVIAANAKSERITLIQRGNPEYIYCALRPGITGSKTELGNENMRFLDQVGSTGAKILAGFGITERTQVDALTGHAHAAVVGTAFIRAVNHRAQQTAAEAARSLARNLIGKRS